MPSWSAVGRTDGRRVCVQLAIIPSPSLAASPRRNDPPPNQQPPPPSPPQSSPTLPTASAAAACVSSSNASFLPSVAVPRSHRTSPKDRETVATTKFSADCKARAASSSGPLHVETSSRRRQAHRRRSRTLPVAASVAAAEIHLLIWLMSERECGMNLDDAGFPRGIQSIHHSAIRSVHLFREGFRRWRLNWLSQRFVVMRGCVVDYDMILDISTNSIVLSRVRKEGHVLVLSCLFSSPARDLNGKNAGRVAE